LLVAAVQFVNIVEFMMVMPLGPDFAKDLHIDVSSLGVIGGSYTAAAAVAGLVASTFVERFDRRKALATAMFGLVIATLVGAASTGLPSLIFARMLAGIFGGPATAISLAVIADVVPAVRRGRAMSTVMMAFSVASIAGVPIGLDLARMGDWRTPFYAVALLAVVIAGLAIYKLPPLVGHLLVTRDLQKPATSLLRRPEVILSLTLTSMLMLSMFSLIPNLSAYVQGNLNYPREKMDTLYFYGGLCSFAIMYPVGRLTDKFGSAIVGTVGSLVFCVTIYLGFVQLPAWFSVMFLFSAFMMCGSLRNIPTNTLTSRVPGISERARFMSLQSAVQHISSAIGAFLSTILLTETSEHRLIGIEKLGIISICLASTVPFLLFQIQKRVGRVTPTLAPAKTL
jgi:predicted MFS family arabinose efflux permease